jgi:fucose 4-O-acetylase-like acetyltransferase
MPLFFYISGIGSAHVKDLAYSSFLASKIKRLVFPMIIAILFLLIPRLYLSQDYEPWTRVDPDKPSINNYFEFFVGILPQVFGKLSWLWFLLVLFEVFLLNYSIIIWLKRRKAEEKFCKSEDGRLLLIHAMTYIGWSTLSS